MPLYGNILIRGDGLDPAQDDKLNLQQTSAKTSQKIATCASMRLLEDHLKSKKRTKQSKLRPQKAQKTACKQFEPVEGSLHQLLGLSWDPADEYDPMVPNSYEILLLERIKAEESRRDSMKNSAAKIDPSILDVLDKLDSEESENLSDNRTNRGFSIAPPVPSQSKVESPSNDLNLPRTIQQATSTDKLDGTSAAAKIMAKMGYKAGQGLGKDQQGMSAPLEVEKSGPSVGRIVQRSKTPPTALSPEARNVEDPRSNFTRVLLLQNMVGPGQVDDDLEVETKMECTKYGDVLRCLIYEIPSKQVPDDEAVRIFIEFKDVSSARKAASDLNGRYFGGRVVRASFFDVSRFNKYELGP